MTERTGWQQEAQGVTQRVGFMRARNDTVVMPDGTQDTYAMIESPDSVTVVIVGQDGRICVNYEYCYPVDDRIHRPDDSNNTARDGWLFKFPGGGFKPDKETPEAAALREVEEETGKLIGSLVLLGSVTNYFPRSNGRDYKYFANVEGEGTKNRDASERDMEQHYFTEDEIEQLVTDRDPRVMHSHFLDTWTLYKTRKLPTNV